jgi:hypothetical protein
MESGVSYMYETRYGHLSAADDDETGTQSRLLTYNNRQKATTDFYSTY